MKKKYLLYLFLFLLLFNNVSKGEINFVPFYKLKVILSTSSEEATLAIKDSDDILTYRITSVSGNPIRKGASLDKIWISQSIEDALNENIVSITVEIAFNLSSSEKVINIFLQQGEINETNTEFYIVSENKEKLIRKVNISKEKKLKFSIDFKQLKEFAPSYSIIQNIGPKNLILAFYYMWYDNLSVWKSSYLLDKPKELYISSDPLAIARQISEASSAGINGFIASWWGPNSPSDDNLKVLLNEAEKKNFLVSIYLEILTQNEKREIVPREVEEIYDWLKYIITEYGKRYSFLKIQNKPVIFIYSSHLINIDVWRNIFNKLNGEKLEALYIGTFGSGLNALDIFDGLHYYNILSVIRSNDELDNLKDVYARIGRIINNYPVLINSKKSKLWIATIQPGYDDHLLPDRHNPIIKRNKGETYRETFEAALNSNPSWIIITTWNEWWEHTYIEPSIKYKDNYLKLTKEFSKIFSGCGINNLMSQELQK